LEKTFFIVRFSLSGNLLWILRGYSGRSNPPRPFAASPFGEFSGAGRPARRSSAPEIVAWMHLHFKPLIAALMERTARQNSEIFFDAPYVKKQTPSRAFFLEFFPRFR
jgi:hypothetical protein